MAAGTSPYPARAVQDDRDDRVDRVDAALTATAPAKLNPALRVGARRRDGYHALATLFQALDLADEVTLRATPGVPGVDVQLSGPETAGVPADASNLAVRAVHLLAERVGRDLGVDGVGLALHKAIPAAAGLAGGSADAAAALVAADALWRTRLPRSELVELAAALGADVPFSLRGGTAVGTGRGDVLAPALARGEFHWVLAFADSRLPTPSVFAELDRLRGPAGPGGPPVARTRALVEAPPGATPAPGGADRGSRLGVLHRGGHPAGTGLTRIRGLPRVPEPGRDPGVVRRPVDGGVPEGGGLPGDSGRGGAGNGRGGAGRSGAGGGDAGGPAAADGPRGPGVGRGVRALPPPIDPAVPAGVLTAVRSGDPAALGRALVNDLQPAALSLLPDLRRCLAAGLDLGALGAVLCGSGPTWAFLLADRDAATAFAAALADCAVARAVVATTAPAAGARVVSRQP